MKKFLFLSVALLTICVCSVSAQQHFVFRLGGGVASHYGNSARTMGAFNIGLGYEYEFDQHWSVEPCVLYFSKGWKNKDEVVPYYDAQGNFVYDEEGNQVFGKKGVKSHTNYIEVPVLFNYYIHLPNLNYINFNAGPYFAYGIGGKTETYGDTEQSGAGKIYHEHNTFDEADAHRFDMGVTLGAAYEFNRQFNVSVSADLGLLDVKKSGGKNYAIYLGVAYKF